MRTKKERKKAKKAAKGTVTEFTITYFDMSGLEKDALINLYTDHAYKFGERHGVEAHVSATTYPSVERWEAS